MSILGSRRHGISIHAPREGGDEWDELAYAASSLFQSTPPARGATLQSRRYIGDHADFNPRPPRGGRLEYSDHYRFLEDISIHAPREGGDSTVARSGTWPRISIHAPREGGDGR